MGIQTEAIRIRARRGEADLTDLDIFASIAFQCDRFSSQVAATPDLIEYFAKNHKTELTKRLETALALSSQLNNRILLVANLAMVDPCHKLVAATLTEILKQDWSFRELFTRSNFPGSRIVWTPEMIRLIEAGVASEKFFEHEAYWISKILPLPSIKRRMIASLNERDSLAFWAAQGLAEGWGKNDPEVLALFTSMLDAPSDKVAQIADQLPLIVDDKAACRATILRALREMPTRADFLVLGMKQVVLGEHDEEAFKACYEAGSVSESSLYEDMWRKALIISFPSRPEVRALAELELDRRDGNIGTVAQCYATDRDMCSRVLKVISPLPQSARLTLISQLELAATSSDLAFDLLHGARNDTDGTVCGETILGWAEACAATNAIDQEKLDYLATELRAVGSQFEHRRSAAVLGLGLVGKLSPFANARDHQGKTETISLGGRVSISGNDDRYLRRLLPLWDQFSEALGGEDEVVRRLELRAEACLSLLNPGIANVEKLLKVLQAEIPTARHVRKHDHIGLLLRFAPDSDAMRDLIMPLLLNENMPELELGLTNSDVWAGMMAAEAFADHFSTSRTLVKKVSDRFALDPDNSFAAAALAEIALRQMHRNWKNLSLPRQRGIATTRQRRSSCWRPFRKMTLLSLRSFPC